MLKIGCHLSSSRGFLAMGKDAVKIGANTLQFFTRNPRGSKARKIDSEDVASFLRLAREKGIAGIMGHAPYTLNPCSASNKTREFTLMAMTDDVLRMEYLPHSYYTFHPGNHVGQGVETGISLTAAMLNQIMQPGQTTTILLETMSGKGTEIGSTFAELRQIIDRVTRRDRIGVCLDTCHVYDAGYDIVNDLDGVLQDFDRNIGLENLLAIHLNDSSNPLGSRKDRHAAIGKGTIGLEAMVRVINHPRLRERPFFLETPNDLDGYAAEIALLREAFQD